MKITEVTLFFPDGEVRTYEVGSWDVTDISVKNGVGILRENGRLTTYHGIPYQLEYATQEEARCSKP